MRVPDDEGMPVVTADLNPDPGLCAGLRADLQRAGYTADAVRAAWGPLADEAVGHGLHGPALTALAARAAVAERGGGSVGLRGSGAVDGGGPAAPGGELEAASVLARLLFLGGFLRAWAGHARAAGPDRCCRRTWRRTDARE